MPKKAIQSFLQALIAAAAACLAAGGLFAAGISLPPLHVQSLTLANRMRVLLEEDHHLPVVTVEVWYHVGSKNELPGESGFAHLFEHLMFDGTRRVGPGEFSSYIIRAGGDVNAYTTQDVTVFWETIPSAALRQVLWLEADRMRNLEITRPQLDNERQVVEEEGRQRFANAPYGMMVPTLYAHAFTVHPYHHLPIGTTDDLNRATVDEIKTFYDTYYVPNDATLLAVGDFNTAEVQGWVEQDFGSLARGQLPMNRAIPQEPKQTAARIVKLEKDVSLPAFIEGFRMPPDGTPDSYPLELLIKILSGGRSSLIEQSLIREKQIAVDAEVNANFTEDPNLFFIFVIMNAGYPAAEGEKAVEEILDRLKRRPLSAQELERAKNQIMQDWVLGRETTRGRAEQLGEDGVILRDPALVNTEIDRALTLTPKDVQAVARKYFVPKNMTLVEFDPAGNSARPD